jgi:hypothetical protein
MHIEATRQTGVDNQAFVFELMAVLIKASDAKDRLSR